MSSGSIASLPGVRTNCEGKLVRNRILVALPDAEYENLRPLLSVVDLPRHASLYEPGQRLEYVYFPNRSLISLMIVTRENKTVGIGAVGSEGLIGIPALVGLSRTLHRAMIQIAGDGFRSRVDDLRNLLPSTPQLQFVLSRQAVIQGTQAAQFAACNRLHGVEQRLARWLLLMQDRATNDPLLLTHDCLAAILGTDRPSVSLAAGTLQQKGAIAYTRGVVNVLSREKIEEAACECYRVIKEFANNDG